MSDGNFKVRCVLSCSEGFSIRKEYDVINGVLRVNNGKFIYGYYSVEEINSQFASQFELVEEKENAKMSEWNGKIRCVSSNGICCYTKDKVYIVKDGSFLDDGERKLSGYESFNNWCEHSYAKWEEVKEVKEVEDLRKMIKPCMLVVTRNGDKHITMQTVDGIILVDKDGRFFNVKSLDVDLKAMHRFFEQNDVMRVYGLKKCTTEMLNIDEEHRDLIWEREKKSPQQVKIKEIERKQRELADELAELRKDM